MANRTFQQRFYSLHTLPVFIDGHFTVGATGAVGTVSGPGIKAITRLSAGTYQVQLQDNYYKFFTFWGSFGSPVTGSALTVDASDAALSVGTVYQIVTVGTSTAADFLALGLPAGVTPAVGCVFKAALTGSGVGSGTVKAIGTSSMGAVELVGDPNTMNAPTGGTSNQGSYIVFQTLQPQQTGTTTNNTPVRMTVADPAQNSVLYLAMLMSNSSVKGG